MRITWQAWLLVFCALIGAMDSTFAMETQTEFNAAYAVAEAAEKEAGILRNQWTATEAALAEARNMAAKGDFKRAIAAAKEAEALARASIFQATQEKEAWKDREIH